LLAGDASSARAFADDGFTALQLAAFLGNAESVRVLVDAGADVNAAARNEMKVQPLHAAAARPAGIDIEACRILLEAGADPNAHQQGGYTPMDEAVLRKHDALIALLREHGARPAQDPT
jgi:ankyrin repeat protein